ncbi:MAG: hypothetical protein JWP81_4432 [Ferruginibacter sp.]|nr:hypothetical protein [Ferruginibacter sp.]
MKKNRFLHSFFVLLITLLIISCGAGLHYSKSSDTANSQIITEAQTLLSKSSEPYNSHAAEVDSLKAHIDRVVADEARRGKNDATKAMWTAVQKDKQNLYDFFNLWKQQGTISQAAVTEIGNKMMAVLNVIQTWEQRKKDGPLFNH